MAGYVVQRFMDHTARESTVTHNGKRVRIRAGESVALGKPQSG